jgi:uncharacterized protein (TIGR00299 family) protein
MRHIAYLDCPAGVAGDMVLAALLDAGADLEAVRKAVRAVAGRNVAIETVPVSEGLRGLRLLIDAPDEAHDRSAADILASIAAADIPEPVRTNASRIFDCLAVAEGKVHAVPLDQVHFHEVGALDSIADIVGVAAALHSLGIARGLASPLPLTRGTVHTRHGLLPVPAPATLEVLSGFPVYGVDVEGEFVTPTGAAICVSLGSPGGPPPPMRLLQTGVGFGTKKWPDGRPNCVRVLVGIEDAPASPVEWEIAANLDDLTPEGVSVLADALFTAGAKDAWSEPIVMKKGRPAWTVCAIATEAQRDAVSAAFFAESTTIGLRMSALQRVKLPYEIRTIPTSLGDVRVKVAFYGAAVSNVSLESDDVRRLAAALGLPVRKVREQLQREIKI